tara:strand:- start:200 stop:1117 length:918 start_codon:yes stop_codon:yes gene_type:complete
VNWYKRASQNIELPPEAMQQVDALSKKAVEIFRRWQNLGEDRMALGPGEHPITQEEMHPSWQGIGVMRFVNPYNGENIEKAIIASLARTSEVGMTGGNINLNGEEMIVLGGLDSIDYADPGQAQQAYVGHRMTLIHELVHEIDPQVLYKDYSETKGRTAVDVVKNDPLIYYNTPHEVNAYINSMITLIRDFIPYIQKEYPQSLRQGFADLRNVWSWLRSESLWDKYPDIVLHNMKAPIKAWEEHDRSNPNGPQHIRIMKERMYNGLHELFNNLPAMEASLLKSQKQKDIPKQQRSRFKQRKRKSR